MDDSQWGWLCWPESIKVYYDNVHANFLETPMSAETVGILKARLLTEEFWSRFLALSSLESTPAGGQQANAAPEEKLSQNIIRFYW